MEIYLILVAIIVCFVLIYFLLSAKNHKLEQKIGGMKQDYEATIQFVSKQTESLAEQSKSIDSRLKIFSELKENVGNIVTANQNIMETTRDLTSGIHDLRNIFTATKARGVSGEIMLENLLRTYVPNYYEMQYRLGSEIVDAVIKLDNLIVPIDSKFPYFDKFNEMTAIEETTDESKKERRKKKKELISSVKKMIDDVKQKYIHPENGTTNFALIYIPAENIYYELVVNDENMDIHNYSLQNNVVLVSPNSMFSYLYTIYLGLKGLKINEDAKLIFQNLNAVSNELAKLREHFQTLGGHITKAYNKYAETDTSLTKVESRFQTITSEKMIEESDKPPSKLENSKEIE